MALNRRKAKKAFKKKWSMPWRLPLLTTVPRRLSPRVADKLNERFESRLHKAWDDAILYGKSGPPKAPKVVVDGTFSYMAEIGSIPLALADLVAGDKNG